MPNQPKTPAHTVRVPDELWVPAVAVAAARGETISDAIRQGLTDYVTDYVTHEREPDEAVQRVLNQLDQLGRDAHETFNQHPDGTWDTSPLIARDRAFLEAAHIVTHELIHSQRGGTKP